MLLQIHYDRMNNTGIDPLVKVLKDVYEVQPWMKFPPKKPVKRADAYCELVLGVPWKPVLAAIKETEPELYAKLSSCVNPGVRGETISPDNIRANEHGTSESYTLNRLKRKHNDLFNQVINGELSANAAAIEAGFRPKTRTVNIDSPDNAINALLKVFDWGVLYKALQNMK